MKTTYRVAIAGCHRMLSQTPAGHNHAAGFHAAEGTEVVAVFDHGEKTRRQFVDCWRNVWGDVQSYGDYEQMLNESKPDIVCIATRQTMHAHQIETAVKAGVKAVMCEKPMATSMAEVDRIAAACKNVPFAFALDRRWTRRYRTLLESIKSGIIGKARDVFGFTLPNLINHGCHWYDTLLMLSGDPTVLWASGKMQDLSKEPEDSSRRLDPTGHVQVGLSNGAVMHLTPEGKSEKCGLNFEVVGDAGRLLIYQDGRRSFAVSDTSTGQDFFTPITIPEEGAGYPPIVGLIEELIEGIQTGKQTSCNLQKAVQATEIGFAVHHSSARNGARITLPLEDRTLQVKSFPWGNE